MKASSSYWLLLACSVTLLTGCATTKKNVEVRFQQPLIRAKAPAEAMIAVQKLKDARGVNPHTLAYTGAKKKPDVAYVTKPEVADIVTDALKETLTSIHYKVADDTDAVKLSGDIVKFNSHLVTRWRFLWWWAGGIESSIQLNLKLTDPQTGALLWREPMRGYAKINGLRAERSADRERVAAAALQDAMIKFGASESFQKAVQNYTPK